MNQTTKTKSLVTIIIFLLITNIAMLVFFILLSKPVDRRQRNRETNGMYTSLQNEVGFSKDQLDKYQLLRKEQMDKVKPLFNEVRNAKKDFYGLIYSSNVPDSLINADADSIAKKQKTLDLQMYDYFKNIRNICTLQQTQKFDSVIKKVVVRMVARPGKDNHENKK
ncbi:MAG: Spy/CpxP family protein refolding chaperone [Ginsengibacter sp.]